MWVCRRRWRSGPRVFHPDGWCAPSCPSRPGPRMRLSRLAAARASPLQTQRQDELCLDPSAGLPLPPRGTAFIKINKDANLSFPFLLIRFAQSYNKNRTALRCFALFWILSSRCPRLCVRMLGIMRRRGDSAVPPRANMTSVL